MVCLDLDGARADLCGTLARRLLEIRPSCFVGSLSARAIEQVWKAVEESRPKAALMVYPAKNEMGLAFKSIGKHRYEPRDNFGIQLMAFRKR